MLKHEIRHRVGDRFPHWICPICLKEHVALPQTPVRCSGPGHEIYLSPEYFSYTLPGQEVETKPQPPAPKAEGQATLF
jgi:hypothetical protein